MTLMESAQLMATLALVLPHPTRFDARGLIGLAGCDATPPNGWTRAPVIRQALQAALGVDPVVNPVEAQARLSAWLLAAADPQSELARLTGMHLADRAGWVIMTKFAQ